MIARIVRSFSAGRSTGIVVVGTSTGVRPITETRMAAPVVVIASSIVAFVAAGVALATTGVAGTSAIVTFVTA